jgi:hypothetical protein
MHLFCFFYVQLLTPQQALEDAVTLLVAKQKEHKCSSEDNVRCPVREYWLLLTLSFSLHVVL